MILRIVLRMSFLAALAVVGWIFSRAEHRKVQPTSPEAIRLPQAISVLFGNFRADGVSNIRGVILQSFIYVMTPIFTLMVLGTISQYTAAQIMGITATILLMIWVMHYMVKRGRS
jgi:hypothetical protein